ncbi:MAG: M48 family peptidase [Candidatus Microsaccharimonas sossegonensis]|uniref:M48 family peptidase n=1 Tax=Candidatus Microsaccharimonas sossegonensis TaxID=2506948 RepID=A0A4Q0AI88_9BACT|nr:MAG: M48 family peptidase [Candidatus Microsaccharimonas sossegonensis]
MPIIHDEEFGNITIRRSARASQVRLRVAPDGTLRASLPLYAPIFLVKRLLKTSRDELRNMLSHAQPTTHYENGMRIGKSHTLVIQPTVGYFQVNRRGQQIIVSLPADKSLSDPLVARAIRDIIIAALRIEAKSYLPKRLAFLANKFDFQYKKVRFSHASGRWGSCTSEGTISLNIALMKLPFEQIDYVLFHELAHTKHMNHSPEFWSVVAVGDPQFKEHRKNLKQQAPTI